VTLPTDYTNSLDRSLHSKTRADRPRVFRLGGLEWDLLGSVFPPVYSPSTAAFLDLLEFPVGGSLLEIGCGAGVIAVSAALSGCSTVVATDINPEAVRNTELNANRHGVAARIRCTAGDLFDPLEPDETFDVVFWHSNFVSAPADLSDLDMHDIAYVDPGYNAHRRYLSEAPRRGNLALMGFSSRGSMDQLRGMGAEIDLLRSKAVAEADGVVEYQLLRIR
jgi:release factor glutamine methyltransferase